MSRSTTRITASRLATALVLGALVFGCGGGSGGGPSSPTSPGRVTTAEVEFQSFQHANLARDQENVEPQYTLEELLSFVARAHSESMRDNGFFAHQGVNGDTLRQRLQDSGISYRKASENLAKVQGTSDPAAMAHDMLMGSAQHRSNILDPKSSVMGVGVASAGSTYWVTQIFIRP